MRPHARKTCLAFAFVVFVTAAFAAFGQSAPRERISFNADWRFIRHDPAGAGDALDYQKIKPWVLATSTELIADGIAKPVRPEGDPGADVSYTQPGFDDSGWRRLDVPHDWGIEGPFSQDLPGETGKLPWQGVGWYRKHFELPASDAGRRIHLDIDGAMSYSAVWLNGRFVGGRPYGYSSYRLDLTPYVKVGAANVLAIRLDNPENSSRWYPGSGLYRNVWLVKTSPVHVAHWGAWVTTPDIALERALAKVHVVVETHLAEKVGLGIATRVHELGGDGLPGAEVAAAETAWLEIDPARDREALRTLLVEIANPKLWDLSTPDRYVAVTTIVRDGVVVDRVETTFGIRSIRVDATDGFFLNDRRVPIQGVCMHHDLGALGAAVNTRALERQIEILQSMGCNAIRTSHNPPAPELLELCDRMGMLVMDEAFDAWRLGKKQVRGRTAADGPMRYADYGRVFDDWHERDVRALVRRDRNHPSVVMWSIGNEIVELHFNDGWRLAARVAGIMREEDRTRPITVGCNSRTAPFTGFQAVVDLMGYNYKPDEYAKFHAASPEVPVYGSETASTISTRGEYFFPVVADKSQGQADFQMSSYDLYAPRWALTPDTEWRGIDENPYVFGEFVWTGFDYLGEPTPYNSDSTNLLNYSDPAEKARAEKELAEIGRIRVPSRSSYFGIIDLAGFPKDRFFLYQSRWRPDLPIAHILPHWNWPDRVGQVTPVFVYSSGDEVELFLNGNSLGRKKRGPLEYRFRWDDVVHAPGQLRAVAWRDGVKWAEATVKTTGPATRLLLSADRSALSADGSDLSFVTVAVSDDDGLTVPRSKNPVRFTISGPGTIAAVDNGDPTSFEPFQADTRRAFNGLALVIVRTKRGEPGTITLRAEADGLAPAEVKLQSR
jgi:beta-galactosidase